MNATDLPTVNALLNTTSAALLLAGYGYIRSRCIDAHHRCMVGAFTASVLFLISYVIYHVEVGSVHFTGQGWIRFVYFTILVTHVLLAAAVPFLASATLYLGYRNRIDRHRRIARWTLPIWLYVSATGVAVYLMLYRIFDA